MALRQMCHITSYIRFGNVQRYGGYPARCYAEVRDIKNCAKQILTAALEAVAPEGLIRANIVRGNSSNHCYIDETRYQLHGNVYFAAFGKGVYPMVKAAAEVLDDHLVGGIVSVPVGSAASQLNKLQIIHGAHHNLPDAKAIAAAEAIMDMAKSLGKDDILMVFITGGGSALFPLPSVGIDLTDKLQTIQAVASSGGDIVKLNTIRKNLSRCKGGRLARAAYPAKVISFIISDVVGDDLQIISSGPTTYDPSTPKDCLEIVNELSILPKIPKSVIQLWHQQTANTQRKKETKEFDHVKNILIGSNKIAVQAAYEKAIGLGFNANVHSTSVTGEASEVGDIYSQLAIDRLRKQSPSCILGGGETTVKVVGNGVGGRNQELALSFAIHMYENCLTEDMERKNWTAILLSAGTDGQDGPTPAAGAFAYFGQLKETDIKYAKKCLNNNDSYSFFATFNNGDDLLVTGLTNTNVMDMQILLIDRNI